jgi:CheY-specific phosphatase CheX
VTGGDGGEGVPRIAARKYALVIRPERRRRGSLVMKLRANDFRVVVSSGAEQARAAIARMPWLSLLVAQGPLDDQGCWAAVEAVRAAHPELPVLWVRSGRDEAQAPADRDDFAFADRCEVVAKAEALLGHRFYPAFLIDLVSRAAVDTLREQFETEAELLSVSLKLTRNTFGEVVPILPLGGDGVSGQLALDTVESQLARIRSRMRPRKLRLTLGDLGDLGGELLNQTAGRIKAGLRQFGNIELGLPVILTGKTLMSRSSPAPTLLFDFAVFGRHLFLEFSLTALDAAATLAPAAVDQLGAGELSFL